jgi:flavin reductase (DIM6/NTAB) family NADH-FMN oxidoreductase RutF
MSQERNPFCIEKEDEIAWHSRLVGTRKPPADTAEGPKVILRPSSECSYYDGDLAVIGEEMLMPGKAVSRMRTRQEKRVSKVLGIQEVKMVSYSSQFADPVVLVTVAAENRVNVMTVGWASPVSFKPPILMVSIAPPRYTHDLLLKAGEFGVSVLADDQHELSTVAGTLSGRDADKLSRPEFETIPAETIRAPLIAGARAWFECRVVLHQSVGDHTVFYGEVQKITVHKSKRPLVLFDRMYYSLGDEIRRYP